MDNISILVAGLPFVAAHPVLLVVVLPALFWLAAHGMTFVPAPTATSNSLWKAAYPILNSVIAANYGKSVNAPIVQELNEVLATVTPFVPVANTTPPVKG